MATNKSLGKILKQRRGAIPMTLKKLSTMSGISSSHLGRIERGERFPSALMLRKMASPLGFAEGELFSLAGYLSQPLPMPGEDGSEVNRKWLDPYVSQVLGQEPVEVQRTVISLLGIIKRIAQEEQS